MNLLWAFAKGSCTMFIMFLIMPYLLVAVLADIGGDERLLAKLDWLMGIGND